MTAEYITICEQVEALLKGSKLSEMEKYAVLTTSLSKVARQYNNSDFAMIRTKLAIVCKTMLDAVEKAEELYTKLKK